MVKGTLALFQLDSHGTELPSLLWRERGLNRIHIIGEIFARQQIPTMTARHVMNAAIVASRVVQPDPTG